MKNPSQIGYNSLTYHSWEGPMDTNLVSRLLEYFKTTFGLNIQNAEDLFETQRNLLEYLIRLGRELENRMFEELGKEQ